MAGFIVPEEHDLASALIEIADKHGKFNEDSTGIWAGYKPAEENKYKAIGVKCGNCVLYRGGTECAIIALPVEPEGKCRFAVIPDGVVDKSYAEPGMDEDVSVENYFVEQEEDIPPHIRDVVKEVRPNDIRVVDIDNLVPTQKTVNMRRVGDVQEKPKPIKVWERDGKLYLVDGHHRTVSSLARGKEDIVAKVYSMDVPFSTENALTSAGKGPCWDGYKQVGTKEKNGKMVPNCVPDNEASVTATAGSKPAPKKDRIKGSKKNKKGSASTGAGVTFSASVTKSLEKKVEDHNAKAKNGRKVTLRMLKAVYRRGAGAFSSSHRPDQNRNSWSMARVNAFLKLVKSGKPNNSKYVQDNDLLPKMHPRHSEASNMSPLMASLVAALDEEECPPATQDIELNLKNRQNAIDNVGYGPLNPKEPNDEFWQEKADKWKTSPEEAKKSVCGNCVFFVRTPEMLECISTGIEQGGSSVDDADASIDQAELGYCEALDFKCAASRTCNAWAVGGPIT
jgi:hypothetical protein